MRAFFLEFHEGSWWIYATLQGWLSCWSSENWEIFVFALRKMSRSENKSSEGKRSVNLTMRYCGTATKPAPNASDFPGWIQESFEENPRGRWAVSLEASRLTWLFVDSYHFLSFAPDFASASGSFLSICISTTRFIRSVSAVRLDLSDLQLRQIPPSLRLKQLQKSA